MTQTLHLGQMIQFSGNPFAAPWQDVTQHNAFGGVVIESGKILDVGTADDMRRSYPMAQIEDHGSRLILPGFVDAHVHYPQTAIIASWGKRLIDWLNTYTFPEEIRLSDPNYANLIANRYLDLCLANGTTTVASYCTSDPVSVTAFFEAANARGMRVVAGKTCMDRNAPPALCDTPQRAYDESKALLQAWHGTGRAVYAITPRFAPTSTPKQMEALGTLWREHPTCLMQTHLSEQTEELAWVADLFPNTKDYLDVYAQFGLLGDRGLYGHAIHLTDREVGVLADVQGGLVHCPTSNTFIGSGLFDMTGLAGRISTGLATDTGGGSSFSMLRTMAAAYEVGQLRGAPLHPAQLLWLATGGSAKVLHLQDCIGQLTPGHEADMVVLDLASTPAIAQRTDRADDIWEAVFPTIMMGDDRAIAATYVAGQKV
ncbi:MAG: guanine deaminase [Planktomarina sp.]